MEGINFLYIRVIFVLTRFSGVFPFRLTSKNELFECNGIIYTIFPISLTFLNTILLIRNFVDFSHEQYFTTIVQFITHVNTLVYVLLPFFVKKQIKIAINACLTTVGGSVKYSSSKPFAIISVISVIWLLCTISQPIGDRDVVCFLICLEKFILGMLETQLCFLLCHCNGKLIHIEEEVNDMLQRKEGYYWQYFTKSFYSGIERGSLENTRKKHMTVFRAMDNLNRAYGVANFSLTMRERFSFAFHLYCWIGSGRIIDLMLASVNFCKMSLIFYNFQKLKNSERSLIRVVNELEAEIFYRKEYEAEYLKKQVNLLHVKFEACGLFLMDMNMIISIVTTTAGYLLLLNQLNL